MWGEGGNPIEVQTERMGTYVQRVISTQQAHDRHRNGIVLTSMRRQYDDGTSVRRHLDMICRLGTYYS